MQRNYETKQDTRVDHRKEKRMRKMNLIVMLTGLALALLTSHAAAMYNPTLGRFLQRDPAGYGDGLNLCQAINGNPICGVDPAGLKKILVIFEGAAGPFVGAPTVKNAIAGLLGLKGSPHAGTGTIQGSEFVYIRCGTGDFFGGASSDGVDKAIQDIKPYLGKQSTSDADGCYNTIAVIGHSWGGDAAWEFIGRLAGTEGNNTRVNLVATFDARPRFNKSQITHYYKKYRYHDVSDVYENGYWNQPGFQWGKVMPVGIPGVWLNYHRVPGGSPTADRELGGFALGQYVPDENGGHMTGVANKLIAGGFGEHFGIVGGNINTPITEAIDGKEVTIDGFQTQFGKMHEFRSGPDK
jgi:hypothetical protein